MYREGSLERDLTIWTFRFGCVGMLKQIFSAEILKATSMDVTQTNACYVYFLSSPNQATWLWLFLHVMFLNLSLSVLPLLTET